jgi:DNA (cytosine-5)-methyltransferase 1
MSNIEAVDLFCGAGGLTHGLMSAGVKVRAGYDIDPECEYAYITNHPEAKFIHKDVTRLTGDELKCQWSPDAIRLLAGCAPCQPFSTYSRSKVTDHAKWGMLFEFARLVKETLPDLVTMENVPGLAKEEPFANFLETLVNNGYCIVYKVLNSADYGVPQRRRRLVLLASRLGKVELPTPTHPRPESWVTVRQAVGHLPAIQSGETHSADFLHKASRLSTLNQMRIKASKAGGTWRDWPQNLVADCHQKESGKNSSGVYGRMSWDKPAPTMTTLCCGFGNGRFGHPEQDRAISLREAAIFQSFPANYRFAPEDQIISTRHASRLIGNAVPPKLGEAVGKSLMAHIVTMSQS